MDGQIHMWLLEKMGNYRLLGVWLDGQVVSRLLAGGGKEGRREEEKERRERSNDV